MQGAPPPEPGTSGSPSPAALEALRRGHEAGRSRHGELDLAFEDFARDVLALVAARRTALGLAPDAGDAVASLALEDLYLARACDRGSERAWRLLNDTFASRLRGLCVARGVRGADADAAAADVLSDLALPAPRGAARTLIGTYAGSGSLWAWLAATLVRRAARAAPKPSADPPETAVSAPPWRRCVEDETARQLDDALRHAWTSLEPNERLCLAWKHRDGLEQRRIAALLGVGEHQVSRWISRAVAKIRGEVDRCADRPGDGGDAAPSLWERLGVVVSVHLARLDAPAPPPPERSPAVGRAIRERPVP